MARHRPSRRRAERASSSKALARRAAAVQLRASAAAKHRHSNRATLASIAPLRRATAALSRVEPQPPWPGVVQLAAKPGAALPRPRALAHRQCCAAKALPRRATPASAAAAHSGSNHATLTGAAPTRPSRPLLHGAAAGAQLPLTNRAAAAQPQRHWHSRQQLPAVVAAAVGIGSTGAPPPRRVSSKTGFKQSGRAAAAEE